MVTAPLPSAPPLLEMVAAGDREAFCALVDPHLPALLSFAVRVAPDEGAGEDALQDVLGQAYQTLQRKSSAELKQLSIRPWLFKSLINRIRRQAGRRRDIPAGLRPPPSSLDAEAAADQRALLALVDAELRRLPRDWRAAILLRHHAGYAQQEIAAILDRPSGTVKAWIHRGMRRVREALPADIYEGGNI